MKIKILFAILLFFFFVFTKQVSANSWTFYSMTSTTTADTITASTTELTYGTKSTNFIPTDIATGTIISIKAQGVINTASYYNFKWSAFLGPTKLCGTPAVAYNLNVSSARPWIFQCDLVVTKTGTNGFLSGTGLNYMFTGDSYLTYWTGLSDNSSSLGVSMDLTTTTPFAISVRSNTNATSSSTSLKNFYVILTDNSTSTSMGTTTVILASGSFNQPNLFLGIILFLIGFVAVIWIIKQVLP